MASPPNGVFFPSLDECLKGNKLVLYVNIAQRSAAQAQRTLAHARNETRVEAERERDAEREKLTIMIP